MSSILLSVCIQPSYSPCSVRGHCMLMVHRAFCHGRIDPPLLLLAWLHQASFFPPFTTSVAMVRVGTWWAVAATNNIVQGCRVASNFPASLCSVHCPSMEMLPGASGWLYQTKPPDCLLSVHHPSRLMNQIVSSCLLRQSFRTASVVFPTVAPSSCRLQYASCCIHPTYSVSSVYYLCVVALRAPAP